MIEVGDILTQDLAQVSLIEDKHVIQTLGSHRSHPSLGDRVGLRRSERSTDLRDAEPKDPEIGSVRLNLQDVKTPMAGILRPSVHTTRPGRLRGSA